MESFQWGDHFLTGLPEVDAQHHYLVNIINQLSNLLTEDEIRIRDVDEIFSKLADYAEFHFRNEEKLMEAAGLDARYLDNHVGVHRGFLEEVTSIYSGISAERLDQARFLLRFLIYWLGYHILGNDQDMAMQVKAIKSGMNPSEAYNSLEQQRLSATAPLLEALNGLFEQVTMRNRELKMLNESLEEQVALRTRELSEANLHLEELSRTDALTGLPNRRHAMRSLSALWDEALKKDLPLVCVMIDADHFKEVNDDFGHDAGDRVLKELAITLMDSFRSDDIVCRLGGDEFLIICPATDKEGGLHIAEVTRKAVSELRIPTGGKPWHGSVSVGVAVRLPEMKTYDELIKAADKGVYAAKEAGKNCVRLVAK
ncbi:MAG: GGDEF domain-containing protein [Proteobacteria bacterium]|nr:GGDEF domain-containing protein [Pseudomonadota bacterium]MBU1739601.1 GGDEF domain-containing protein [Pseudomonadota bacterium]